MFVMSVNCMTLPEFFIERFGDDYRFPADRKYQIDCKYKINVNILCYILPSAYHKISITVNDYSDDNSIPWWMLAAKLEVILFYLDSTCWKIS